MFKYELNPYFGGLSDFELKSRYCQDKQLIDFLLVDSNENKLHDAESIKVDFDNEDQAKCMVDGMERIVYLMEALYRGLDLHPVSIANQQSKIKSLQDEVNSLKQSLKEEQSNKNITIHVEGERIKVDIDKKGLPYLEEVLIERCIELANKEINKHKKRAK